MKKILFITILIAVIIIGAQRYLFIRVKGDRDRLSVNQNELIQKNDSLGIVIIGNDSIRLREVTKLTLTEKELRLELLEQKAITDALNVRIKDIEAYNKVLISVKTKTVTELKDTIIEVGDTVMSVMTFKENTKWLDVSGIVSPDTLVLYTDQRVDFHYLEWITKHQFLWVIKWGVKGREQTVYSTNPDVDITESTFVTKYRN